MRDRELRYPIKAQKEDLLSRARAWERGKKEKDKPPLKLLVMKQKRFIAVD